MQERLRGGGGRAEEFKVRIRRGARGFGELAVFGPDGGFDEDVVEECLFADCSLGEGPRSFAGVLDSIANAPRNDVLRLRLSLFDFDEEGDDIVFERQRRRRVDRVVTGAFQVPVVVRR